LNSNAQRFRREKSKRYFAHVATSLMSPVRSCRRPRRNGHLHGDDRSAPYHAQIGRPSNAVRSEARGDLAGAANSLAVSLPKTPSGGVAAVDESQHNCG